MEGVNIIYLQRRQKEIGLEMLGSALTTTSHTVYARWGEKNFFEYLNSWDAELCLTLIDMNRRDVMDMLKKGFFPSKGKWKQMTERIKACLKRDWEKYSGGKSW